MCTSGHLPLMVHHGLMYTQKTGIGPNTQRPERTNSTCLGYWCATMLLMMGDECEGQAMTMDIQTNTIHGCNIFKWA